MKTHPSPFYPLHCIHFVVAITLLLALTASCQTAEPYSWNASTYPPQTARLQIWRGDTLPLAPTFGRSDTNSWTFTTYWSTNNITWWSKSLVLDPAPTIIGNPFIWTPDMDCGASKYRLFILASNTGGGSYRANADITMLASPGTTPNILPLPIQTIDFATTTAINAPWLLPASLTPIAEALHSISNALAMAVQTNHIDKLWLTPTRYTTADGKQWEIVREKGYKIIESTSPVLVGMVFTPENGQWPTDDSTYEYFHKPEYWLKWDHDYGNQQWSLITGNLIDGSLSYQPWDAAELTFVHDFGQSILQRVDHTLTNLVTTFATTNDIALFRSDLDLNALSIDTLQTSLVTRVWHTDHAAYIQDATLHSVSNFPATYTVTVSSLALYPVGQAYIYSLSSGTRDIYHVPGNMTRKVHFSSDYGGWAVNGDFGDFKYFAPGKSTAKTLVFYNLGEGILQLERTDHVVTNTAALATEPYVDNAIAAIPLVPTFPPAGNVNLGTTNNAVIAGSASSYDWAPTALTNTISITTQPRYPFDIKFDSTNVLTYAAGSITNINKWVSGKPSLLYYRPTSSNKWEFTGSEL